MSEQSPRIYELQGNVNAELAAETKKQVEVFIDQSPQDVEIRLDGLESHNSLVVGLMMGWMRYANRQGKQVSFSHLPERLMKIIDFSGLTQSMPLAGNKTC